MKDAVHSAVHRSVHLRCERKLLDTLRLHMARRWILNMGKTQNRAGATPLRCHGNRGGRSSPRKGSRQQKEGCCAAVSRENPIGASEEGKNCSLPFCASLISAPHEAGSCQKRRGMSDMTNRKVTEKKRLNRAVATPLFGGPSAQKFRGVATARHAGSVTV